MSEAQPTPPSRWSRQIIGPFTLGHLIVLSLVLLIAAALLALLNTPRDTTSQRAAPVPGSDFYQVGEPNTELAIGQSAPELDGQVDGETVSLYDVDGELVTLEALRGAPVWLTFFATWCPACQEETPVLREAHQTYSGAGLEMIAISVQETTPADVEAYAERFSLPYRIGFDVSSAVFNTYQGFGLPTHVFIDADGVIQDLRYGQLDRETVAEIVEPLLADSTE